MWRKAIARSPQGRLWQARSCPAGAQLALRFAASINLGAWPHWVRYNQNILSGDFRGWSSSRQREPTMKDFVFADLTQGSHSLKTLLSTVE